jgi:hypothetical protein
LRLNLLPLHPLNNTRISLPVDALLASAFRRSQAFSRFQLHAFQNADGDVVAPVMATHIILRPEMQGVCDAIDTWANKLHQAVASVFDASDLHHSPSRPLLLKGPQGMGQTKQDAQHAGTRNKATGTRKTHKLCCLLSSASRCAGKVSYTAQHSGAACRCLCLLLISACCLYLPLQSYALLYFVSLKRQTATNRVLYIPTCTNWGTSSHPFDLVLRAVRIAFHKDPAVLQDVDATEAAGAAGAADQHGPLLSALLGRIMNFCHTQVPRLRLYLVVDQVNALDARKVEQAPFHFLKGEGVPNWAAMGAAIVIAVSDNNGVGDEVSNTGALRTPRRPLRESVAQVTVQCVCCIVGEARRRRRKLPLHLSLQPSPVPPADSTAVGQPVDCGRHCSGSRCGTRPHRPAAT